MTMLTTTIRSLFSILLLGGLLVLVPTNSASASTAEDTPAGIGAGASLTALPGDTLAVTSGDVRVVTPPNGDLVILGDDGDNFVEVHGNGMYYTVYVHLPGDAVTVHHLVGPITRNVNIDLGAGSDTLHIGRSGPITVPGSLLLRGDGVTWLWNTTIGEDLLVRGSDHVHPAGAAIALVDPIIGDDLDFQPGDSTTSIVTLGGTVGSRAMFIATGADEALNVQVSGTAVGRVHTFGGPNPDVVRFWNADLGHNPVINLAGGDDVVDLFRISDWTGQLVFAGGDGHDQIRARGNVYGPSNPLGLIDFRMGEGDDVVELEAGLVDNGAGSRINGHLGTDTLESNGAVSEAKLFAIEHVS